MSIQSLVLEKNSTAFKYFKTPPLNPQLRVHIFNYTNTERFLSGEDDKLIVQDVGPYVYTEKTQKVDVVYNDNNTISYRVLTSYQPLTFQAFFVYTLIFCLISLIPQLIQPVRSTARSTSDQRHLTQDSSLIG